MILNPLLQMKIQMHQNLLTLQFPSNQIGRVRLQRPTNNSNNVQNINIQQLTNRFEKNVKIEGKQSRRGLVLAAK